MNHVILKPGHLFKILVPVILILSSCSEGFKPGNLQGIYTGKERVIIRYDKGGQYIYRDESVLVSIIIDSGGNVNGMVGEATFENCNITRNRGWIERQLGIKTDFLISGKLKGNTFEEDTIINKNINIPINIENGELKGSLLLILKGEDFPMISKLKLKKGREYQLDVKFK